MEKRNIQISLEEAKKWYYSGNATLRTLATQAYTKEELTRLTLKEIKKKLGISNLKAKLEYNPKNSDIIKYITGVGVQMRSFLKLSIIAKYFNGDWEPELGADKYYIGIYKMNAPFGPELKINNTLGVFKHINILYPGVVYFKNAEDAVKAYEILNEEE